MANTDATFDIILILLVTVLAVIVKLIIKLISCFNKKTAYIVRRMSCCSYDEYRYWRRELRCHYLCLIPFVTKKNVAKVYHHLFYKPKYMKKKAPRTDGFYHVIAPSLLSICLCAICLCGVSWAWFTSSQSSSITQIQSARYDISVDVQNTTDNTTVTEITTENGIYKISLVGGNKYKITITAAGTATEGYCTVKSVEKVHHTSTIKKGDSFEFSVQANANITLIITPQWGSCSDTNSIISKDTPLEFGVADISPSEVVTDETTLTEETTTPPVSNNEDADNNTENVTPTTPTEQTDPLETTEETQPIKESSATESDTSVPAEITSDEDIKSESDVQSQTEN